MPDLIIRADDVRKVFAGSVMALDGLSLEVQAGTIYGLLGPNGAGKTTLIRVLATLLRPDSGSARVAGIDVLRDPSAVRRVIGLAGQYAAIDEYLTGRENVELIGRLYGLPRREARARTAEVLSRIDLVEAGSRQVKTYSGGMRRRIDLAASLVGRPKVMFLDEPTTGIDPASRRDVWDLIRDLGEAGTTVVLTTQYLEEADQLASRIGVIDRGRLIDEGTPEQLKGRIGGSVLELTVAEAEIDTATRILADLTPEPPVHDGERGRVVLPAPEGARTVQEALQRLSDAGITPADLDLHKPTLDDVFLTLTGHNTAAPVTTPDADSSTHRKAA